MARGGDMILGLAVTGVLAGCSGGGGNSGTVYLTPEAAQDLIGLTRGEAIARLGPPLRDDGSALIYQTRSTGGQGLSPSALARSTCTWTFDLDTGGRIEGWIYSGGLCDSL